MRYRLTLVTKDNFQEGVPVVVLPVFSSDLEFKPQNSLRDQTNQLCHYTSKPNYATTIVNKYRYNPNPLLPSTSTHQMNNSSWQIGVNPGYSNNFRVDPYEKEVHMAFEAAHPLIKEHLYVGGDELPSQIYIVFKSENFTTSKNKGTSKGINIYSQNLLTEVFGKLSICDVESFQNELSIINKESIVEDYYSHKVKHPMNHLSLYMNTMNTPDKHPYSLVLCYFEELEG